MGEINQTIYWMGGIMTQPIPILLAKTVSETGAHVNVLGLPSFEAMCEELYLGKIDELVFLKTVCSKGKLEIKPEDLREKALAAAQPIPEVVETINLLSETVGRWLVIDYPKPWFEKIAERLGIRRCFTDKQFIFLAQSGLSRLGPDLFKYLAATVKKDPEDCLFFDLQSRRSVQALNYGMASAIFVDSRRLKREYLLRKMIAENYVMHGRPTV
jgi:FMN phosphatase YigB (HAD superfamily)